MKIPETILDSVQLCERARKFSRDERAQDHFISGWRDCERYRNTEAPDLAEQVLRLRSLITRIDHEMEHKLTAPALLQFSGELTAELSEVLKSFEK